MSIKVIPFALISCFLDCVEICVPWGVYTPPWCCDVSAVGSWAPAHNSLFKAPFGMCFQCLHRCPRPLLWLGHGDEEMYQPGGEPEHEPMGAEHFHVPGERLQPPSFTQSIQGQPNFPAPWTHISGVLSALCNPILACSIPSLPNQAGNTSSAYRIEEEQKFKINWGRLKMGCIILDLLEVFYSWTFSSRVRCKLFCFWYYSK